MPSDLDAYFDRIGYGGSRAPTLDTLRELQLLHPQSIPFENLNPLLRMPVLLDAPSLQKKLLTERRGGYCYEHNLLLKHVLETMGFRVRGLAARVLWNADETAITRRTHMLLLIDLDEGNYIADVGFGGLTLTAPLRLQEDVEQSTPHEPFRLRRIGLDYLLQAQIRGGWRALYRFDLQEQHLADYELTSWYLCNHPQSHFVTRLVVARSEPQRRYGLLDNELSTHDLHGDTTKRTLQNEQELRQVLQDTFEIALPNVPQLADTLNYVVRKMK
jgi:N-hydroxyarylamine O-acetyltransferase